MVDASQSARDAAADDCEICPACNGSGEGVADTVCGFCGGSGGVPVAVALGFDRMPNIVEVEEVDRTAYLAMNMLPEFDRADVLAGNWDKVTGLQAFAAHRIAAEQRGHARAEAERAALVAEVARLRVALDTVANVEFPSMPAEVVSILRRDTARAARAALSASLRAQEEHFNGQ